MIRYLVLLLVVAASAGQATAKPRRYKGHLMQYLSGNCRDGYGVAILSMNSPYKDDTRNQLHYAGTFKDSLMDGEGVAYKTASSSYTTGERLKLYTGHFSEGDMDGYMTIWLTKGSGADMAPDSSEDVCFVRYDRGIVDEEIEVQRDGLVVNYFGNRDYINGRQVDGRTIKDGHLKELAAGFIASRKGRFNTAPSARPVILAVKEINTARGRVERFIDWDCLTDRKYFVTASPRGTPNNQMPFGGRVSYRVLAEDGTPVFEAPVDTYFTPPKPGRYAFQVVFDQNVVGTGSNVVVDGVRLELSLRSRSLL